CDYFHQRRRGVGISLDVEAHQLPDPRCKPSGQTDQRNNAMAEDGANQTAHHSTGPPLRSSAPSEATSSPSFTPLMISILPLAAAPIVTGRCSGFPALLTKTVAVLPSRMMAAAGTTSARCTPALR